MDTIVEILELVGLVLVVMWIVRHIEGRKHGGCACGGGGADTGMMTPAPGAGC